MTTMTKEKEYALSIIDRYEGRFVEVSDLVW